MTEESVVVQPYRNGGAVAVAIQIGDHNGYRAVIHKASADFGDNEEFGSPALALVSAAENAIGRLLQAKEHIPGRLPLDQWELAEGLCVSSAAIVDREEIAKGTLCGLCHVGFTARLYGDQTSLSVSQMLKLEVRDPPPGATDDELRRFAVLRHAVAAWESSVPAPRGGGD